MTTFQTAVLTQQSRGVVADIMINGPQRGQPVQLDSADAVNNVIGRAMFLKSTGQQPNPGAALVLGTPVAADSAGVGFAGILANSKQYVSYGNESDGPLGPTMTLPNDTTAEVISMTSGIMVYSLTAAKISDYVFANTTTGELTTNSDPEAVIDDNVLVIGARVVRYSTTEAGSCLISLT